MTSVTEEMKHELSDERLREILAAAQKATPVEPTDLMAYEHGGGRLAILRDGRRQLIADFYGDGEDRDHYANCTPATIAALVTEVLAAREADAWQPIETAEKVEGNTVLLRIEHQNLKYAAPEDRHKWIAYAVAYWTDFNAGGWVWHGMIGTPTHWRSISALKETTNAA